MDYAANFVAQGGFLVYSTCTMNPKENEDQISAFLKKNKHFELIPAGIFIPDKYTSTGYLKTIPFKHNMDGAFAAKLQRRK